MVDSMRIGKEYVMPQVLHLFKAVLSIQGFVDRWVALRVFFRFLVAAQHVGLGDVVATIRRDGAVSSQIDAHSHGTAAGLAPVVDNLLPLVEADRVPTVGLAYASVGIAPF